jgi:hypothetical protein
MSFTHTLTTTWSNGNALLQQASEKTSGQEINIDELVADGSNNLQIAVAFSHTKLQSIMILADQALTLEFNNSTTGVPTIALLANVPFVWQASTYHANPFSEAVTTLYATNASGEDTTLKIRALIDPT